MKRVVFLLAFTTITYYSFAAAIVKQRCVSAKKPKEAFEIFKLNFDKHPNQFTTCVGLIKGYFSLGDYKKASCSVPILHCVGPLIR